MITTFKNLLEAQQYFHSEDVCWQYWEDVRWGGNPVCPHCATVAKPYKLKGRQYKCSDKDCRKKFTALVGTIFEDTKLPLQKWFLAAYLVTAHKKGISSLQLSRDIGVTQKSAWHLLHRLRETFKDNAPAMLEGTVQIDATLVGGKLKNKSNAKRKAMREEHNGHVPKDDRKTTVLGFIANGKTVCNVVIANERSESVLPVMVSKVKEGSTVVTDESQAYRFLRERYTHVTVNHNASEYVKDGFTTNGIESYFAILKRGIYGIYHSVSKQHLHRYCDEFSYRFNTREIKDAERFDTSISRAEGKRLTYKRLVGKV